MVCKWNERSFATTIRFQCFGGRLMSHSRSNNFTYIFLTGKGGEWKKKAFLPYVIFP